MRRAIFIWTVAAVCFGLMISQGFCRSKSSKDMTCFLRQLTDLDRLPYLEEGVTCRQFSSYDRASKIDDTGKFVSWEANADHGQYIRVELNGEAVMAEMEGPGCLVQIWSANPRGRVRFYFDGAAIPFEFDFARMTSGEIAPFTPPIASRGGSGYNSYLPMPYAKSCKVTADKAHDQYYHIDYMTFPAGAKVQTFHLPLSEEETNMLNTATGIWNRVGEDPKPARPHTQTVKKEAALSPGQAVTLADLAGPAIITSLKAKLRSSERYALRKVLLRAFWDGSVKPSIEAPIGDFFGTCFYENKYKSLPMGMTEEGGYCYFTMPFRRNGRIEVVNEGKQEARLDYEMSYAPAKFPSNTAYFHAKWRRTAPNAILDWPFLECQGRGRYVGVMMNVADPDSGWFGEGDEKVWVDDEKFPSWFGTGTEDYFCDAWGFRVFARPMHGVTLVNIPGRTSVYRWHVMDNIPFQKQLKITIENYGKNKDYSCTTYWYQLEPAGDFFESVPVEGRLPWPNKLPGMEAETLTVAGTVQGDIINDETSRVEFSEGKALRIVPREKTSTAELTLPVKTGDVYQVTLTSVQGSVSPAVRVVIGEQELGKSDQPFTNSLTWTLERVRLRPPTAQLVFTLTSETKMPLDLDTIQLIQSAKKENAFEAENLAVTTGPETTAKQEDARLDWSGWSQMLFEASKVGDWVEMTLPADLKGRYKLQMGGTQGPDYGIAQAFFGEQPMGSPFDGYAEKPQLSKEVGLGEIELPEGKTNGLTFKIIGKSEKSKGYKLGLDYFRFNKIIIEDAIEAENLKIVQQDKVNAQTQNLGEKWSCSNHLFCPGSKGQFVVLEVPVAKAGHYLFDLYFTQAGDYGIVDVSIDGKMIGKPFDGYNGGVIPSGKVSCGDYEFTAGPHLLKLEVIDKNPASSAYFMGIDCMTLTPVNQEEK